MSNLHRHIEKAEERARRRLDEHEMPQTFGPPNSPPGVAAQRFRVREVRDNFLVARTWDGTTEGEEDAYVAKDPLLRRSTMEGAHPDGTVVTWDNAYTITVAHPDKPTATYQITPSYVKDGGGGEAPTNPFGGPLWEIWAINVGNSGVLDDSGNPIQWLEIPSRSWGQELYE